jgi:replicative DNA helicase
MTSNNGHRNGTKPAETSTQDRMAPHSIEAEESVLGSILLNPDSLYEVVDFLKHDDFFIVRNGWVYEAIMALTERSEKIDNITLAEELREQKRLDEVGGIAYIAYLINHTPSSIYTETYGRIVERAAIRRRMLDAASAIAKLAHEESEDINIQIDGASAALDSAIDRKSSHTSAPVADIVDAVIDDILAGCEVEDDDLPSIVETGFRDLDELINGFEPEEFILLAGRPGSGKSSLILTLAYNQAKKGIASAISSLEMSKEQIVLRLISIVTGISVTAMKKRGKQNTLSPEEKAKIGAARASIKELPIIIDDDPSPSMVSLKLKARVWVRKHGIAVVYTDYLQLYDGLGDTREAQVSYVSRKHKQLARELGIPVVASAQLNRSVEERKDKRPQLHDLRESGSLEQDSDKVIFIYRDEMYNEATEYPNQADLIVAKHRNGPTGTLSLFFRKELTQFAPLKKTDVDFAEFAANSDADNSAQTKPPEPRKPRSRPWYEDKANDELEKMGF